MPRSKCAHCGLPVMTRAPAHDKLYCCSGCYLVSRIVGEQGQQGPRAWSLLRLSIGSLLAMNVMMIALLLYTGHIEPATVPLLRWASLALAAPVMILLGYPFLAGAVDEFARRQPSLDTLIAAGSFTAFAVSAVNTVRGAGHIYFDTATMLPVLVTFGRLIEATAKTRTNDLTRTLETLLPRTARRVTAAGDEEVDMKALRVNDRVRVHPGERIAVDGRIVEGHTDIREADFTGEPLPRVCRPGDPVVAGTINGANGIVVQAERVGEDLLLHRIIAMVEQAREATTPWERMTAKLARLFIPVVFLVAVAAGLFWLAVDGPARGGLAALAVVVVACPCALGIATPLATALGISRAARAGVLTRGGDVLERIGQSRMVFFDKTGTVTTVDPALTAIEILDPVLNENELLAWLATLETGSEHPLGRAVVVEARRRGIVLGTVTAFQTFPGLGVRGRVARRDIDREILAGTEAFVQSPAALPDRHTATTISVAWENRIRGRVRFADQVRPEAAEAVRRLHAAGIQTVLLSGDRLEAVRAVGEQIAIGRVEAPRRPDEKIASVRATAASGGPVIMVGDGINDAPALAAADIGVALGAGTDLARQTGQVVLLSNRLLQIPWLIQLSRATRRIIAQNLAWAVGYNAIALTAAAAGQLHPLLAALAMAFSSITLLANSVRIARFPDP